MINIKKKKILVIILLSLPIAWVEKTNIKNKKIIRIKQISNIWLPCLLNNGSNYEVGFVHNEQKARNIHLKCPNKMGDSLACNCQAQTLKLALFIVSAERQIPNSVISDQIYLIAKLINYPLLISFLIYAATLM